MNCFEQQPTAFSEDPVKGFSIVFSIRHPLKQKGELKNNLQAHTTRQRIQVSSLNSRRRFFFVENNNLHCLPSHCTGILVAYSPYANQITKEKDVVQKHQWFLGTIIYHSFEVTSIAPTEIDHKDFEKLVDSKGDNHINFDIKVDCAVTFSNGHFKLRFLNIIRQGKDSSPYPFICASLNGPDSVPRSASMKKIVQDFVSCRKSMLLPNGISVVPSNYVRKSCLLEILHAYNAAQRKKIKRRTMAQPGTHVVEIEGHIMQLRKGVDGNYLLVPIVDINNKATQRYCYVTKDTHKCLSSEDTYKLTTLNEKLLRVSKKVVDLIKYDVNDFLNGLIFVFRHNQNIKELSIVREWDTSEPMEHWQFNGTVLSHWIVSQKTYSITMDHLKVMESVYGHKGFNRSSVDSIGINIYTGIKSSPRAIANPL